MMDINKKAFTLVEMITVMVIVGILLGFVLTGSFNAIKEARIEKAKAAIKAAKAALEMYEADVGNYPVYTGSNDFKAWLQDGDGSTGWNGSYMNFVDADLDTTKNHYIDPWGQTYGYDSIDGESYQLWSYGPDQVDNSGNGDDINSWD